MRLRTLVLLSFSGALLYGEAEHVKRLEAAADVLEEIMGTPDKAIPQGVLDRSECMVVVPSLKKAGFILSGKYGRGFLSCRKKEGVGWTGPGAVRIEGGGFGLQIGASETDVVMLVMNQRGVDKLLSSKFTLGVDAMAAAGPVGRTAQADTDAQMRAEILTWSRSRGLFAGVSLQGATLRQELSTNKEVYGRDLKNRDIVKSEVAAPAGAERLMSLLNKYSSRKGR